MLTKKFGDESLRRIIDQALVYRCACPAQLAELILKSRAVYDYEVQCLEKEVDNLPETHRAISAAVAQCHTIYEECLDRVLELEGWDKNTFEMPLGLRTKAVVDPQ